MTSAGAALDIAGIGVILAAVAMKLRRPDSLTPDALLVVGNVLIGFADILNGVWQWSILSFAVAAVMAWLWWHRRKRRKRAGDALGAKSRALRDALIRRTRQAAKPRPVLRPVPGGVR
jgi:membrane protein implicated in regulation of membrane protease activity